MSHYNTLHTLTGHSSHQRDIRKSRFLAQSTPVTTSAQALDFVHATRDSAATHNCWAYRVGNNYRFHDDGEPGGTAGRPILQAIESQAFDRVAVVVTRWFGGVKLGAGGLIRAYGGTAAECLRLASSCPIIPMARLSMHCDFAVLALLRARLAELEATIEHESFDAAGAHLAFSLPAQHVATAEARIADVSRGRSTVHRLT